MCQRAQIDSNTPALVARQVELHNLLAVCSAICFCSFFFSNQKRSLVFVPKEFIIMCPTISKLRNLLKCAVPYSGDRHQSVQYSKLLHCFCPPIFNCANCLSRSPVIVWLCQLFNYVTMSRNGKACESTVTLIAQLYQFNSTV